jgi:hypothetical protein
MASKTIYVLSSACVFLVIIIICMFYLDLIYEREEGIEELEVHRLEGVTDPTQVRRTKFTLREEISSTTDGGGVKIKVV